MIEEIANIQNDLYLDSSNHKTNCFLHLYEFLIFLQVYLLMQLKNYERALYQLIRIKEPVNEMNILLHKVLIGICQGHCLYYDLSVYNLCQAYHLNEAMLLHYKQATDDKGKSKKNIDVKKQITRESKFKYI